MNKLFWIVLIVLVSLIALAFWNTVDVFADSSTEFKAVSSYGCQKYTRGMVLSHFALELTHSPCEGTSVAESDTQAESVSENVTQAESDTTGNTVQNDSPSKDKGNHYGNDRNDNNAKDAKNDHDGDNTREDFEQTKRDKKEG